MPRSVTGAYVTYANTPEYLLGAQVLLRSLRAAGATAPFVLMVPDAGAGNAAGDIADAARRLTPAPTEIRGIGNVAADIAAISGSEGGAATPPLGASIQPRYAHCLNKLALWKHLTHYELVCWLDADMIVLENLDPLFDAHADIAVGDIVAAPGCTCNALRQARLPTRPDRCPFRRRGGGGASALAPSPPYINTGLFLTRPSRALYARLLTWDYDHPFPEQDAFSIEFAKPPYSIRVLPPRYNYLNHLPIAHPETPTNNIAVFHFGYNKPWDRAGAAAAEPLLGTESIARWYYALWHAFDRGPVAA